MRFRLAVLTGLIMLLTVGGVFASWAFAEDPAPSVSDNTGLKISIFDYAPEEILPGGDIVESELGGNHYVLVDLVLNESNKGYGLNISNNVVLHKYLKQQPVVYSNQKVSGGNLKFILDPQNNTHGLYYCVEKVTDTEYYCYTFSTDALATAAGSDVMIPAYRTTLVKTDYWRATVSYLGNVKTASLSSLGVSADSQAIKYSIVVSTWEHQLVYNVSEE